MPLIGICSLGTDSCKSCASEAKRMVARDRAREKKTKIVVESGQSMVYLTCGSKQQTSRIPSRRGLP